MPLGPLYPILDAELAAARGHDLVACARGFADLGIEVQQLRAKALAGGPFLRLAQALAHVVPLLIVNDRADVALLAAAAGVHVGQGDLPAEAARGLGCARVGVSTHSLEQARAAAAARPDYLAVGPVFSTTSKLKPDPVVGVQLIRQVRDMWPGTLVAIGGINLQNCSSVWQAGANAVAVISALWDAADPVAVARQFQLAFEQVSCHIPQERPAF
ncbi:MAG: thiamine phosphate synthase [Terriglobales bacterium]